MKNRSHFSFTYGPCFLWTLLFLWYAFSCLLLHSRIFFSIWREAQISNFAGFPQRHQQQLAWNPILIFIVRKEEKLPGIISFLALSETVLVPPGPGSLSCGHYGWTVLQIWFSTGYFPFNTTVTASVSSLPKKSSLIAGQRDSSSGRYRTTKQVPNRLPWLQILPVAQRP